MMDWGRLLHIVKITPRDIYGRNLEEVLEKFSDEIIDFGVPKEGDRLVSSFFLADSTCVGEWFSGSVLKEFNPRFILRGRG